jgi:hypothetical protein
MFDQLISTADRLIQKQQQVRSELSTSQQVAKQFANTLGQGIGRTIGQLVTFQGQISSVGGAFQSLGQTIQQTLSQVISKLVATVAKAAALRVAISLIPGVGQVAGASSFTGILAKLLPGAAEGGFVEEGGIARIHEGESVVTADAVEALQEKIGSLGEVGEEDSPVPAPPDVTLEAPSVPPPQVTLSESSDPARGLAEQLSSALPEMSMPTPAVPEFPESFSVPTGFFSELKESVTAALPEISVPAPTAPEPPESFSVPTGFFSELKESVTAALPEMSVPSPTVSLPDIPPVEVPMPDGGEPRRISAASSVPDPKRQPTRTAQLTGGDVIIPGELIDQAAQAGSRRRGRTGR